MDDTSSGIQDVLRSDCLWCKKGCVKNILSAKKLVSSVLLSAIIKENALIPLFSFTSFFNNVCSHFHLL